MLLTDKPAGITSFQALNAIKKKTGTKKVGHAGTLDKFATGLLLVFTGWSTRIVPWFTGLDKKYTALVRFGEETNTLDPEGEVVAQSDVPEESAVRRAIEELTGEIEQVPPAFSAVHTNGERAYRLARAGKAVELKSRRVTIHSIELAGYDPPHALVAVHCSKGTYIRSLARDLAIRAGTVGHVRELRRTAVGPFGVDSAVPSKDIDPATNTVPPAAALRALGSLGAVVVEEGLARAVRHGKPLQPELMEGLPVGTEEAMVLDGGQQLLAVVELRDGKWRYRLVVPEEPKTPQMAAD